MSRETIIIISLTALAIIAIAALIYFSADPKQIYELTGRAAG